MTKRYRLAFAALLALLLALAEGPITAQAWDEAPAGNESIAANLTPQDDGPVRSGTFNGMDWCITNEGELVLGREGAEQTLTVPDKVNTDDWPWSYSAEPVTSVYVEGVAHAVGSLNNMFSGCPKLAEADLSGLDTSSVTDMFCMFGDCSELSSLDVSGWNTSSVTDMGSMFRGCSSLATLDLSNWNTSSVTDMSCMFNNCSALFSLDVSSWDTSSVMDMGNMFWGCSSLFSLDVSRWNTSSVTEMGFMFRDCSLFAALDLSRWDTSSVTDMSCMFDNCSELSSLNVSGWNTSSVTDMGSMFQGCSALSSLDVSGWSTSSVTGMRSMFQGCSSLSALDLSRWDTSSVTDMRGLFCGCYSLASLDLSGWDTSGVERAGDMFLACTSLASISVGEKYDTSKAFPSPLGEESLSWTSAANGQQYSASDIASSRNGVADTYTYVATNKYYGTFNGMDWHVTNEGELILGKEGSEQTLSNPDMMSLSSWPWSRLKKKITSVSVDGTVHAEGSIGSMLAQTNISSANLSGLDTSSVTNTSWMFYDCSSLASLDLAGWDTSSVADMTGMFEGCSKLASLDVSGWDTSSVVDMANMFSYCSSLASLDVSGWDTSSMVDMNSVFVYCSSLASLDVSDWDTSSVTNMNGMFACCTSLSSLDPSGWDTSSVTDMNGMFDGCTSLTSLDVSGWDTAHVESMLGMFEGCTSLESLDLSGWDTSAVQEAGIMFFDCTSLAYISIGEKYDTAKAFPSPLCDESLVWTSAADGQLYYASEVASMRNGIADTYVYDATTKNYGIFNGMIWRLSDEGELVLGRKGTEQTLANPDTMSRDDWPWSRFGEDITSVRVEGTIHAAGSIGSMFAQSNISSADLSGLDTSDVKNISYMFEGCSSLVSLNLSSWDTSSVTEMKLTFAECSSLESLDVTGWVTSQVTDMMQMFENCSSLSSLDLSGWDTSHVKSMIGLFSCCSSLASLDLSGWDTSSVTRTSRMFDSCWALESISVGELYDCSKAFPSPKGLSTLVWKSATDGQLYYASDIASTRNGVADTYTYGGGGERSGTFDGMDWRITDEGELILGREDADQTLATHSPADPLKTKWWPWFSCKDSVVAVRVEGVLHADDSLKDMLRGCVKLEVADLSGLDVSDVDDMSNMFTGCSSLASLDLSGWDTSSATDMLSMFNGCSSLASLDVSGWDTSSATDMGYMFSGCSSLTSLDVSGWDISSVTNMGYMFSSCSSLASLDVSGWDTSSVTKTNQNSDMSADMAAVFWGCSSLASLDVSGWDTSSATSMWYMFNGCSSLASLDLSGWDTSSVTDMTGMFEGCSKLASLDVSGWDTSAVGYADGMFHGCSSLATLDLSGWDTSSVRFADDVFRDCSSLATLDLSSWDTSSVKFADGMFHGCSSLTSLDLSGWDTSAVKSANWMFEGCTSLASISIGEKYDTSKAFPSPLGDESLAWTSAADGQRYSAADISSLRNGVADAYTYVIVTDLSGALVSLEYASATYTGSPLEPRATVTLGGVELAAGADYELSYASNTEVGTATVTVAGRGSYTGEASVTFEITPIAPAVVFADVASSGDDPTPHAEDIQWLAAAGISTGWPTGDGGAEFRGWESVKRQDMAAFLYRLAGSPTFVPTPEQAAAFVDVDSTNPDPDARTPHADEILWLASEGISTGWPTGDGRAEFRGTEPVRRQDMAAFLHRLAVRSGADAGLGGHPNPFRDVFPDTPHSGEILWLADAGVTTGWPEGDGSRTFRGMDDVVRQDMAAFLHRIDPIVNR